MRTTIFILFLIYFIFYIISLILIFRKHQKEKLINLITIIFGLGAIIGQCASIIYYGRTIGNYLAGSDHLSYVGDFQDLLALIFYLGSFLFFTFAYFIIKFIKKRSKKVI